MHFSKHRFSSRASKNQKSIIWQSHNLARTTLSKRAPMRNLKYWGNSKLARKVWRFPQTPRRQNAQSPWVQLARPNEKRDISQSWPKLTVSSRRQWSNWKLNSRLLLVPYLAKSISKSEDTTMMAFPAVLISANFNWESEHVHVAELTEIKASLRCSKLS